MNLKRSCMLGALVAVSTPALADECSQLANLKLPHVQIILAKEILGGTFHEDTAFGREGRVYKGLPDFCRVRGIAAPVPGSEIQFEVWLPRRSSWTKRLHMIGNGAYSSNISYALMATRLHRGDIAVATNTGHHGRELTFAIGKPESIVDFAHRAVHESVVAAKAVSKAYYSTPVSYSYFSGCSTGGYQGLSEAQRYPEDFNGIIAGAPGNNRSTLNMAFLWNYKVNHRADGSRILPASKLGMITAAVVQKCDRTDGVTDGVIGDLDACKFDPSEIQCKAGDREDCLTAEQVETVRKLYAGPTDVRTGKPLYPGYVFGSEGVTGGESTNPGWSAYWANNAKPDEPLRLDFFRYWVYNDPNWNWKAFNWGSDIDAVNSRIAATFNATNPDLRRFRANGGKMIMFMGWQDPVGAAGEAINYYKDVEDTSRAPDRQRDTQQFLRLYMVPGMAHCAGGPGATHFSTATRDSEPPVLDAKHDMAIALEEWVEKGKAPGTLVATKFDEPKSKERKIAFQRPLCVYPEVARYKGGPENEASSFACVAPK